MRSGARGVDGLPIKQRLGYGYARIKIRKGAIRWRYRVGAKTCNSKLSEIDLRSPTTAGDAVTCGSRALNCSQRWPRAERISAFERSAPRFCFNPRSMASRKESGRTPGTAFVGTLPANGLTPCVPGMAWPGVSNSVVSVCARVWVLRTTSLAAKRNARLGP